MHHPEKIPKPVYNSKNMKSDINWIETYNFHICTVLGFKSIIGQWGSTLPKKVNIR